MNTVDSHDGAETERDTRQNGSSDATPYPSDGDCASDEDDPFAGNDF